MSRLAIEAGTAIVQPISQRIASERTASGFSASGGTLCGCVAGRQQGQPGDASGMVDRQRQGHRAAERVADDQRPLDAELRHQPGNEPSLLLQRGRLANRRIARARPVEHDEAVLVPQLRGQRVGVALQLRSQPVDHHDRRPRALVRHSAA